MIGLDTNVLARYFVAEADADAATEAQRQAARKLIESGEPLYLPKTVVLELEWVLRGYYGFGVEAVLQVLDLLLEHPSITLEDRPCLVQAVAPFDDRGFARRVHRLKLLPRVITPSP